MSDYPFSPEALDILGIAKSEPRYDRFTADEDDVTPLAPMTFLEAWGLEDAGPIMGFKAGSNWKKQPRDSSGKWVEMVSAGQLLGWGNTYMGLRSIEKVHKFPQGSSLHTEEKEGISSYSYDATSGTIFYRNGTAGKGNDLVVEIGRYVNRQLSKSGGGHTSAVYDAIYSSEKYKSWAAASLPQSNEDMFARAYAQWIATRSGDADMRTKQSAAKNGEHRLYWSDKSFAPIAAQFDQMFADIGLLRGRHIPGKPPKGTGEGVLGFPGITDPPLGSLNLLNAKLVQLQSAWKASLSPGERQGIGAYQGSNYPKINKPLRGMAPMTPWAKGVIKNMDSAIGRANLPQPIVVHRGYGSALPNKLIKKFGTSDITKMAGRVVREDGYVSTSVRRSLAKGFGSTGVVMEIEVPAGSPAMYYNAAGGSGYTTEYEILLPRGTKLQIISAEYDGTSAQRVNIKARVIPDGNSTPVSDPLEFVMGDKKDGMLLGAGGQTVEPTKVDYWKHNVSYAQDNLAYVSPTLVGKDVNKVSWNINMMKNALKNGNWAQAEEHNASLIQLFNKAAPAAGVIGINKYEDSPYVPAPKIEKTPYVGANGKPKLPPLGPVGTNTPAPYSGSSVSGSKIGMDIQLAYTDFALNILDMMPPDQAKKVDKWLNEAAMQLNAGNKASAKGKLYAAEKLLNQNPLSPDTAKLIDKLWTAQSDSSLTDSQQIEVADKLNLAQSLLGDNSPVLALEMAQEIQNDINGFLVENGFTPSDTAGVPIPKQAVYLESKTKSELSDLTHELMGIVGDNITSTENHDKLMDLLYRAESFIEGTGPMKGVSLSTARDILSEALSLLEMLGLL